MATHSFRTIKKEMAMAKWQNGYLIYGEETYLIRQLLAQIAEAFVAAPMRDIDLIRLKPDKLITPEQIQRIKQELQTPAFLSERKVIIVENSGIFAKSDKGKSGEQKELRELALELFSYLNAESCLVFWEETIDKRYKNLLDQWQKAGGTIVEVGREELPVLRQWMQIKAQKAGLNLELAAADSLINRCESDMEQINLEFSKAILYAQYIGSRGVTASIIALVCRPDLKGTVFNLTDAVAGGKSREVVQMLKTLLALKEPLPLLRFMFVRHIRQLICAKELQNEKAITKELGVYPFVAKRLIQQAQNMRIEKLEHLYRLAFISEWRVKSGEMEEQIAFETLLIEASLAFAA